MNARFLLEVAFNYQPGQTYQPGVGLTEWHSDVGAAMRAFEAIKDREGERFSLRVSDTTNNATLAEHGDVDAALDATENASGYVAPTFTD